MWRIGNSTTLKFCPHSTLQLDSNRLKIEVHQGRLLLSRSVPTLSAPDSVQSVGPTRYNSTKTTENSPEQPPSVFSKKSATKDQKRKNVCVGTQSYVAK